ncbi:MAG: NADPH:quinone oxidoreductase family protein [Hyphomicrobiaceae bacterium]|nr:NADPH:quinone oxidoreductase family protein [Hyphomicrobiaceae bacterium]
MRALRCHTLGDLGSLSVDEVQSPSCGAGQVRIGVRAAGVNFPDILMIEGKYQVKPPMPFIPGLEVAGVVMEAGAGVGHVKPGDRVIAFARHAGGYASEIVLPGGIVTPIPQSMDFETAAAFPVAYGTAQFALDYRGKLKAGETLVVLGAAGGVGLAAIECGKLLGARVIAAAGGADKLALAREYGADEVVDYRAENLRDRLRELTGGNGVDVVFDPVGGGYFDQCVRAIGWEGRILVVGFASGEIPKVAANLILVKNFSVVGVVFGEHSARYPDQSRALLTRLLGAWEQGRLKPRLWRSFPLERAAEAFAEITSRRVQGKMVLTI